MNRSTLIFALAVAITGASVIAFGLWSNREGTSLRASGVLDLPADPASDPLIEVVVPAGFTEAEARGERIFAAVCAACHGAKAAGRNGVAPPLVHPIYRPGHHADAAFHIAVQNGVRAHHWRFGDMPPIEGVTRAEVEAIIVYVRALQRANGIE